jgi:hypothetical protein
LVEGVDVDDFKEENAKNCKAGIDNHNCVLSTKQRF